MVIVFFIVMFVSFIKECYDEVVESVNFILFLVLILYFFNILWDEMGEIGKVRFVRYGREELLVGKVFVGRSR